ncbi:MAG: glycosyltransferase family 4 protein [Acidobacteriota bacterium]|nr:glycosyltransferase family 4 protein [Acidobacteriota bacterium]
MRPAVRGFRTVRQHAQGSPLEVTVISTVHDRTDVRVFRRQAETIATLPGFSLTAVVADGLGDEELKSYRVKDLGKAPLGRFGRLTLANARALFYLLRTRPDVVHFHAPELIPACYAASVFGSRIIYDVHEDLPKDILDKHWIPRRSRPAIAWLASRVQQGMSNRFATIVAATPSIARAFPKERVVCIQNFPKLSEFAFADKGLETHSDRRDFVYLGGITQIRGLTEVVRAIGKLEAYPKSRLLLAGPISPVAYRATLEQQIGWERVEYREYVQRDELGELFATAIAGIVTFHPSGNHVAAEPNKLFEYMAAGLPVIASDFPGWARLFADVGCGVLVDPLNDSSICAAMVRLLAAPNAAMAMGWRGRQAVLARFNWERESEKLRQTYRQISAETT